MRKLDLPVLKDVLTDQYRANEMMLELRYGWQARCGIKDCTVTEFIAEVFGMEAGRAARRLGWSVREGLLRCPPCTEALARQERMELL